MNQPCARDLNQKRGNFRQRLRDAHCDELVFAIVGQAGSGTSEIVRQLESALNEANTHDGNSTSETGDERPAFTTHTLKASREIREENATEKMKPTDGSAKLDAVENLQNLGDDLRKTNKSRIAELLLKRIVGERTKKKTKNSTAWIIDSLRHPEEVRFFRSIYHKNFFLVGVVCSHEERRRRLGHKFWGAVPERIDGFMQRDEGDEDNSAGQQVAKAFQLADVFVDNTEVKEISDQPNAGWRVPEDLSRFVDLILQTKIIPPTMEETAMHAAYGAAMRSACLSRQVGAALVDKEGRLLATGCNDVPKPGGGLYGQGLANMRGADHRCFAFPGKEAYCRNSREQQEMISDIADKLIGKFSSYFSSDQESASTKRDELIETLQKSRIKTLTEFSRAIHAEMDALLAAARQSISPVGASLFVTTFPCHNCARHIVVAGVREVQYIEPYRKSQATKLHEDAITISVEDAITKSVSEADDGAKVLFRPFTGVAPCRYRQFFQKERELKDGSGERLRSIDPPPWGRPGQVIEAERVAAEKFVTDQRNGKPRNQSGNGGANGRRPGVNGSQGEASPPDS